MITIRRGEYKDVDDILAIEQACFPVPWTRVLFEVDLSTNPNARYWIAEDEGKVIAFVGTHDAAGEINITNVATLPEYQNQGIAYMLIDAVTKYFTTEYTGELYGLTLEVRVSNEPAKALYRKFGFKEEGIRKGYYQDGEDAIIMWIR